MQIGHTRLSPAERQCCMNEGRGIYCAQMGHFTITCPVRFLLRSSASPLVSVTELRDQTKRQLTHAILKTHSFSLSQPVLVDSDITGDFGF